MENHKSKSYVSSRGKSHEKTHKLKRSSQPQTNDRMLRSETEFILFLQAHKIYYFKYTKAKKNMAHTYDLGHPFNRTIVFQENEGFCTYVRFYPSYPHKTIMDRCVFDLPFVSIKDFVRLLEKHGVVKAGKFKVRDMPLQRMVPHSVYSVKLRDSEPKAVSKIKSSIRWTN